MTMPSPTQERIYSLLRATNHQTASTALAVEIDGINEQLGMVRVTRDAYLRELDTLRADNAKLADRLTRADVGPRPTDERIADALERIADSVRQAGWKS